MTLLADVNCPGSQKDVVSNWQPAHSLVKAVVSGAEIALAPYLPVLAIALLSLCLQGRRVLNISRLALLWYLIGKIPLFCEHTRGDHAALEPFAGKVPFLGGRSSLWRCHSLDCYVTLAPSDCPQGIQARSLP